MTGISSLWEFLSRDAAFFGGPESPMLSWIGSFGIVLFFLWHIIRLRMDVSGAQRPFNRVRQMLIALADERGDVDRERFTNHALVGFAPPADQATSAPTRIDCDDLQAVETAMQKEPMFRQPWAQFRKTLILEHVPWFVEPRIFSTRRAEEIFTQDTLLSHRVNLAFYSQLPSLVTGIGLLLTFLALFIGLSKLHADGHDIAGIQGLINGLAGKFLTSIVGLIAANLFTLIEKPMVFQLMNEHHSFLSLIDKLFPTQNHGTDAGATHADAPRARRSQTDFRRRTDGTDRRNGDRQPVGAHCRADRSGSILNKIETRRAGNGTTYGG